MIKKIIIFILITIINDKNGNMLFDENEIKNRWEEYVTDLYGDISNNNLELPSNEDGEDLLVDEAKKAIHELKSGKAAGLDNINTEILKAFDEDSIQHVNQFCNMVYKTGIFPGNLNDSIFIRLPKKPKATECSEYRTLSLMSHILRIILRIILNRNKHIIENEISDTQSGFTNGKGTREGIFNLRTIIERCNDVNKDVYACFIDYQKAFDRVNHEKLIEHRNERKRRNFHQKSLLESKSFHQDGKWILKRTKNRKRCETGLCIVPVFIQPIHGSYF